MCKICCCPRQKNSKIVWRPTHPGELAFCGKNRSRKSWRTGGPCTRWQKGSSQSRQLSKRSTNCLPHGWKHNVEKMHMVDNDNHLDNHQKKMFCTPRAVDASEQWDTTTECVPKKKHNSHKNDFTLMFSQASTGEVKQQGQHGHLLCASLQNGRHPRTHRTDKFSRCASLHNDCKLPDFPTPRTTQTPIITRSPILHTCLKTVAETTPTLLFGVEPHFSCSISFVCPCGLFHDFPRVQRQLFVIVENKQNKRTDHRCFNWVQFSTPAEP